jgi:transposase-like protein
MHCPRCQDELEEVEVSPKWQRHWLCHQCESAWHFQDGVLTMGRNRHAYFDYIQAHPDIWSIASD